MLGLKGTEITRKTLTAGAMLGPAAFVLAETLRFDIDGRWLGIAFAGILAASGVAMSMKQLAVQTLGRGAAWVVLVPSATAAVIKGFEGHFDPIAIGLAAATASALLLSRPLLHSKEAKAQFNPHAYRRTFLAGSTATAATAFITGGIGLAELSNGDWFSGIAFSALTVSLLAVATAVVRMRAWGILLGAATSTVLLVLAAILRHEDGMALAMFAAPMLVLHLLPIFLARARGSAPAENVRVASAAVSSVRYRVASDDGLDAAIEADGEELPQKRRHVHV